MTKLLRFTALAAFLALVLVAMTLPSASQPGPKPVVERDLIVNPVLPPPTVPEMVAAADAVVIGRYLPGARFLGSQKDRFDVPLPPATLHPFEIVTVVKASAQLPPPGQVIAIEQLGGLAEHPTHIERFTASGQRPLGVGRLYAIFLRWHVQEEKFVTPWFGATYDITTDRVWALHEHDRYTGRGTPDFLSELGLGGWARSRRCGKACGEAASPRVARCGKITAPVTVGVGRDQRDTWRGTGQSGMLPCFFGGLRSRFVARVASDASSRDRVWRG